MNNIPDNVLEQIKQLHLSDRRASIKFALELGKLLLTAIVHTGLTEYKVIKLIHLLSTWSVGCLCNLRPRWKPITDWNHGFAIVDIEDSKGNFDVQNFRILPSGKLVK